MADLAALGKAIEAGDRATAVPLTREAIAAGVPVQEILDAMTEAMAVTGARFQANEVWVPGMLIAARAMKECMAILEPLLVQAGIKPKYTAVIGTAQGDLHDIGKNLVAMMWRGANFNVIDLGTNVSADRYVAAVREHQANIVGVSALLTTTMPAMKEAVIALRAAGLAGLKIVIGGAPVTQEFANEIGADGFAADAGSAVEVVQRLVGAA